MTEKDTPHDESPPPRRLISRRGLLAGSAIAVLGVGVGVGIGALAWREEAEPTPEPAAPGDPALLGAQVALPLTAADVDRWHDDIDTLLEHGQTIVRTGIYAWKVAPEPELWDDKTAAFYREQLAYPRKLGLEINLVVPGAPDWAQTYAFEEYKAACTWFWTQMRETYGDQVQLWQAYNEADHSHYQRFTPVTRDATYLGELAELLGVAQETLGRDGVAVTTNLTGWPLNDEREQEWYQVLDAIGSSLDLISLDLYPADNETEIARLPERVERVRQRYGMPIYVAEVGLQTTPDSWTEEDQQEFVTAAIEQLRTVQLWGVCLYELRDHDDSRPGFGIKRADGTHKLGFPDVMRSLSPR